MDKHEADVMNMTDTEREFYYRTGYRRKTKKGKSGKEKKSIKVISLLFISMIFIAITFAIAVIGCNYIVNRNFREVFYNVSSLKIDDKVRIVQISDLHKSSYGKDNSKLIERVKKLNPDLIIYTGDCLDSKEENIKKIVSLCAKLIDTAPSFYIYGNNEVERFYDVPLTQVALDKKFGFNDVNRNPAVLTENADSLEKELEAVGVKVLKNEYHTVTVGSTKVDIFGVLTSNPSSFWSYCGESYEKYLYGETNNLKITAIHEPVVFEEFTPDSWGDLMLCGHTHGGVARIPFLGPVYVHEGGIFPEREGKYVAGKYELSGSHLIVSSGLDNKNLLRINNQPELGIIDINRF